jgi:hypothetical protein
METNRITKFSQTVLAASGLPAWVRENVVSVRGLEEKIFEQSYLNFLDEQIALSPRGPEWTKVLQILRSALTNYCGKNLMSEIVSAGERNCFIKINPESEKILYWELWD